MSSLASSMTQPQGRNCSGPWHTAVASGLVPLRKRGSHRQRFLQLHRQVNNLVGQTGGTGLGLRLERRLPECHRMDIRTAPAQPTPPPPPPPPISPYSTFGGTGDSGNGGHRLLPAPSSLAAAGTLYRTFATPISTTISKYSSGEASSLRARRTIKFQDYYQLIFSDTPNTGGRGHHHQRRRVRITFPSSTVPSMQIPLLGIGATPGQYQQLRQRQSPLLRRFRRWCGRAAQYRHR